MPLRPCLVSIRSFPAAVLALALLAPVALPQGYQPLPDPPEYPFENPPLPGQSTLGKLLFWDEQLSSDNTMACGTCHIHEAGGSDPRSFGTPHPGPDGLFGTADDIRGSGGLVHQDGAGAFSSGDSFFPHVRVTGRKAPSAINAAYHRELFWDGRASEEYTDPQTGQIEIYAYGALESQAQGPPVSDVEMAVEHRTWDDIAAKLAKVKPMALASNLPAEMSAFLAQHPTYPDMFEAVYGDPAITSRRVMFAIGNYERTLVSDGTLVDAFLKGEISAFPPDLEPGFALYVGKANCALCHDLPFTMDNDFHNIGVRPDDEDVGRMAVTGDPTDIAKFKTPGVRNAALRLPLFHDGSIDSLAELVDFYDAGGLFPGPNTDFSLMPLGLTAQEKADLVHFLEVAFTDPRVANNEFPFTRPTLHSEVPPSNLQYGVASANGASVLPELLAHVPANQGHPAFKLGVHRATPNAAALLALAWGQGQGAPLGDRRFPIPMNIDAGKLLLLLPTVTDASGVGTAQLAIPVNAALAGLTLYGQYFIRDAAAVATGGVYGSRGVAITIL